MTQACSQEFDLNSVLMEIYIVYNHHNCNALQDLLSQLSELKVKIYKTSPTYIGEFV